jgi:RNA polymerase sigma factor (sigma-70 family)
MIRRTELYEMFEPEEDAPERVQASRVTLYVSPALAGGVGVQPPRGVELPGLSAESEIATQQAAAGSTIAFSTADGPGAPRGRLWPGLEQRRLEDTQALLRCLAEGGRPPLRLRRAWDEFFRLHDPFVRWAVRSQGFCGADAEDCVQEVWTAILRRLPQFEPDPSRGRFRVWIARLIHNEVVDFARRLSQRAARRVDLPEELPCRRHLDPAVAYRRGERRRLVRHVLGHLEEQVSETNYRLVHLRWMDGHDIATVADELGLSPEQVRYRHRRIKQRLRVLLEAHGSAWP